MARKIASVAARVFWSTGAKKMWPISTTPAAGRTSISVKTPSALPEAASTTAKERGSVSSSRLFSQARKAPSVSKGP